MSTFGITFGRATMSNDNQPMTVKQKALVGQVSISGDYAGDRVSIGASATDLPDSSLDIVEIGGSADQTTKMERLASIRTRLDQGTYRVSSQDLAEALIRKGVITPPNE